MFPARLPADFCAGSRAPIGWAKVRSIKVRSIKVRSIKDYAGNYAGQTGRAGEAVDAVEPKRCLVAAIAVILLMLAQS
jgi:hypothetical protein